MTKWEGVASGRNEDEEYGLGDTASSITETAGRAAERATKGDGNFPPSGELLASTVIPQKSYEFHNSVIYYNNNILRLIERN